MRLGPYELDQIYTGDARELAKAIPDESVDFVFSDPIYWEVCDYEWLAETAARILRPGGDVLVYLGMYYMGAIVKAMMNHLEFRWLLTEKKLTTGALIWSYRLYAHTVPLLWFTKGKPHNEVSRIDFLWSQGEGRGVNHLWGKGPERAAYWLTKFGRTSDIVLDPFCGGGAHLAACKMLGRHWLGFEIDSGTAERARKRVEQTQSPLFVMQPEQAKFEFGVKEEQGAK